MVFVGADAVLVTVTTLVVLRLLPLLPLLPLLDQDLLEPDELPLVDAL